MGYEGKCATDIKVTGTQRVCVGWGYIKKIERTVYGFEIDTEANAYLEATWQTAIQNEEVWPFAKISQQNVNDQDPNNQELALGMIPINKGKKDSTFEIESNPYIDRLLQSHDGLKSGIYYLDNNGNKRGLKGANGEFQSIPVQLFQVGKPIENDGSSTGFTSQVRVVISDVVKYLNDVAIIEASNFDFDTLGKEGLEPVQLSVVGTPTATTLTLKAVIAGTTNPVRDLSETPGDDFTIKEPDGITENAPNTITNNMDGTYDLAFTTLVTLSTANLKAPNVAGVTPGYKSEGAVTITF